MRKTCFSLVLFGLLLLFAYAAQAQIEFIIQYDDGNSQYYSGRPQPNDTCGVWFEPPTESQILAGQFNFNTGMGGQALVYVWDLPDGFDPALYFDNDEAGASPGPTPLGTVLAGPIPYTFSNSGAFQQIVFDDYGFTPEELDVGTNNFFLGYVLVGGGAQAYYPSLLGDAGDDRPYHSLCYLANPGGSYPNQSGWWAYGIDWLVRAKVSMYGDPPPMISGLSDPPDTYTAGPYTITATIVDYDQSGLPGSGQVTEARLIYTIDGGDPVTVIMTNVSGDDYEGDIEAAGVGSLINYRVEADDNASHTSISPSIAGYNFSYREPSGAKILLVNDAGDRDGESFYKFALENNGYTYDLWYIASGDAEDMGYPGADVINTANYNSIIWYNGTANSGNLPDNDADLSTDPVANFMDDGGNFFLSSSDYIGGAFNPDVWEEFLSTPVGSFMHEYLKIESGWSDAHLGTSGESQDTMYTGVAGDPISDDWSGSYFGNMPSPNYNDYVYPLAPATTCFHAQIDDEPAGIRYDGAFKMVFLPWVLEANISAGVAEGILVNVLAWFDESSIAMLEGSRGGIYGSQPHDALLRAVDPDGIASAEIFVSWDGGAFAASNMTSAGGNEYTYTFTPPGSWATLDYYFVATDNVADAMQTATYSAKYTGETYTAGAELLYCSDQAYEGTFGINFDSTITDPLTTLGINFDIWDVDQYGAPDYWTVLANYDKCFWVGYADWEASVFPMETLNNPFSLFLKSGKSLLFSSEEMMGTWTNWATTTFEKGNFAHDYLHIGTVVNDVGNTTVQITDDEVVNGLASQITLGGYQMDPWTDYFYPTSATETNGLFFNSPGTSVDDPNGFRDDVDEYNVVSLGFPLYMMDETNRATFIENVLNYWDANPGVGVLPQPGTPAPLTYSLEQNYPNPFNPVTQIRFNLPENARVELSVYNLMGQEIARLLDRTVTAGSHMVTWDASQYASGIYFYKMKTDNYVMSRKMILVK